MMRATCLGQLLAVVAVGIVAAGCGSGSATSHSQPANTPSAGGSGPAPRAGPRALPAPGPTGRPADPAAVSVVRAWSSALRRGDVRGAAGYFALPSEFVNGVDANGDVPVITIHTRREAAALNASLPCGALFLSADQRGRYVNALFRLTDRPGPGGGCGSGTGQVARTNFVIAKGRIVEWIRAPADPGDNRGGNTPPGSGPPSTPQGGVPAV